QHECILIPERNIQAFGETPDDFAARLCPAGLKTRQVARRAVRSKGELNLRHAALLTPTSKQPSERKLLRVHVPVVVNGREFTVPQCTGSMTSEVKLKRRECGVFMTTGAHWNFNVASRNRTGALVSLGGTFLPLAAFGTERSNGFASCKKESPARTE